MALRRRLTSPASRPRKPAESVASHARCVAISKPRESGQIWIAGGDIVSFSSASCTLAGANKYRTEGKKLGAVYLVDQALGIKMFADKAFYAIGGKDPKKPEIVPFLLKKDAEAHAVKIGGRLGGYDDALAAASAGKLSH